LPSDSGQIFFDGQDVTAMPTHARVGRGLARSFQITRLFKSFTVLDNVALSVQARSGNSFSFWRPVHSEKALTAQAMAVLQELGLQERAQDPASELSHKLLLLDEPMAGAGPVESERILQLIQKLRAKVAILLIEHDMDAVFRLADRISVMVNGALIATGTPQAIRLNPQVVAAYLGEEHA
jgi:branched-chain amino acid transport system ATP-binding protein